jgi:hypothetical protein
VALVREQTILSDHRLSAKLVPTLVDRGCCVVSTTDPYCRILGFLDQSYTLLLKPKYVTDNSCFIFEIDMHIMEANASYSTENKQILNERKNPLI